MELIRVGELSIELTRRNNQKHTYIRITPPDGAVKASAPISLTVGEVKSLVLAKMPEILKARRKFLSQPRQTKREYVSGETFYLWGNACKLRIIYGGRGSGVRRTDRMILLNVPEGTSPQKRRRVLNDWYRAELKRVLPRLILQCCNRIGVTINDWNVRNMRTRWGSCNITRRTILLNLQLVKKPFECLEYVVVHELVHLLERKHSHRFRSLVEKYYPQWKKSRELLNSLPLDYA